MVLNGSVTGNENLVEVRRPVQTQNGIQYEEMTLFNYELETEDEHDARIAARMRTRQKIAQAIQQEEILAETATSEVRN
jgi:hypothetical protein